jgi:hypothetical protein
MCLVFALAATPARSQSQNLRVLSQIGGYCRAVCVVGNIAYIGDGLSLTILDVTSSSPVLLSRILLTDEIQDIAVTKGYAYVAAYNLEIVDVRIPSQPKRISSFDTSDAAFGICTSGSLAYVADRYSGLQIIDVSNPAQPVRRGFYNTSGEAYKVALSGIHAYVADTYGGLQIIRVSNPASPVRVGSFSTRGYACDVAIRGNLAYVAYAAAYRGGGLQIVNVANPAAPTALGYYETSDYARGISVETTPAGIFAIIANGAIGFTVLDVDNPSAPSLVGSYGGGGFAQAVQVLGDRIYLGDDLKDLQVFKVRSRSPSYQVSLIGSYTTPGDGQAVRVSGGVAYVADRNFGLFTIAVSNPTKPMLLGSCRTLGQPWSVSVANGFAYVAARTAGLHVISVVKPALPVLVRSYSTPGEAYAVQVVGNLAYVGYATGAGGGMQVLDVSVPSSPTLRGSITLPDDVRDLCVSGGFAYVANDWTGLKVVDVWNPRAPVLRGSYPTQRGADGVSVSGRIAYVAEYGGSLLVVDVSIPSSPTLRAKCRPSEGTVFVSDGYAWLSGGGLSVYDVISPARPIQRGYSYPPSLPEGIHVANGLGYVAAWQEGLWIMQYTGNAPRIRAATISDANANGIVDANDQLVLTLDRSVVVNTTVLRPSHFFLAVRGDGLGQTGFRVGVNPYNARQVVLTLGQGVRLRTAGVFSTGTLTSGSPSGIDFATSIPFGAIRSLDGVSAVDGGAPGVDDSGVDIQLSLVRRLSVIGRAGGTVSVVNSPDAAYRQHRFSVPANALSATMTVLLRSPAQSLGVIGALQIQSSNAAATFATPATIRLEYREGDVDRERGFLESEMRVHQLVESPGGIFRYLPIRGAQTLNRAARLISVNVRNLNPNNSLGQTGSFAGLPIETVDERTINIGPSQGFFNRGNGQPAVLTVGPNGAYTLHKIEIPNYQTVPSTSPERLVMKIRTATLAERESLCGGCSFPAQSGAVFTVTVNDASSRPVAFNSPVRLTVQFKNRPDPGETDVVRFSGLLGAAQNMRLVKNRLANGPVDFSFTTAPLQTVNVSLGTVAVDNFVGLTREDGGGTFGAVASDQVAPAGHWRLYR